MHNAVQIGIATSDNAIAWKRQGPVAGMNAELPAWAARGYRKPHVVRDPDHGRFVMAFEGIDADGRASIGLATSDDGVDWYAGRCGSVICEHVVLQL